MNKFFSGKITLVYIPVIVLSSMHVKGQPFLDIMNVKYSISPNAWLVDQHKNKVIVEYYNASTNIPVQFNHKKDAVVFSPFVEKWKTKINNNNTQEYYGIALPVSLLKTIPHSKWNLLLTAIVRMNDSVLDKNGKIQIGTACIGVFKKNEKLSYKFGFYINNECFGLFVVPLLGIDWTITSRDNLFGILPGSLTYEHKLNRHFYYGANFRAITNSYSEQNGYWRMDENQLGIYLDTYVNKNIVFNIESGHSLFRSIHTGIKHVAKYNAEVNDNFYLRISLAYRVRLKK